MKRHIVKGFSARVTTSIHSLLTRSRSILLVAAIGIPTSCAAISFAVRASNPNGGKPPSIEGTTPVIESATPLTKPASAGQTTKKSLEVEIVTLRAWGFEPSNITRAKGRFLLAVNNQSQLTEHLTFSMAHELGSKVKEDRLDWRAIHRWNNIIELNPGRYRLTVLEQPEWVCNFTVTAN
jgi:hypothetical protein